MDILELIRKRQTIRKYKDKPIPKNILNKVVEAGRWASSLHGFQPWKFIITKDEKLISNIADIASKKSKKLYIGYSIMLRSTAETLGKAKVLIIAYNTGIVKKKMNKMGGLYRRCAEMSEIEAISAALQNMILVAKSLGIGACWTVFPIFCEQQINKLFGESSKLVAILTLGYPNEKSRRTIRKQLSETVKYM